MTATELASTQWVHPEAMDRVIVMTNDKGGVGKTTLVCNLLGQLAAAGYRVLGVDLNRQANMADDLGYRGRPDVDDQGEQLYEAIRRPDKNFLTAHEVRPNLWVVPGGRELAALTPLITTNMQREGRGAYLALAKALAPLAPDYDLVLIDSPPENIVLVDLGLAAARWVIMPTRSDTGGLIGMQLTAERFRTAREINPRLGLLGVVLFGTLSGARAIHAEVQDDVTRAFGGQSPMLSTTIRYSERVARDARRMGKLAHELEIEAAAQPAFWEALRQGRTPARLSAATASVSADFRALAGEMLDILAAQEAAV